MKKKVMILIPAYNEENNIGNVIDEIKDAGWNEKADIVVINDGSSDKTSEAARMHGAKVIDQIYNMGYGSALQTGYKYAMYEEYDYVLQMDADGQHLVSNLSSLLETIMGDKTINIVIGSRFCDGTEGYPISYYKKFAIWVLKNLIYSASGQKISDPTSGLQALNREAFCTYAKFEEFDTRYPDANMIIQMLMRGFKIIEIPAQMKPRVSGKSMHSGLKPLLYGILMLISVTTVYVREKRFSDKRR